MSCIGQTTHISITRRNCCLYICSWKMHKSDSAALISSPANSAGPLCAQENWVFWVIWVTESVTESVWISMWVHKIEPLPQQLSDWCCPITYGDTTTTLSPLSLEIKPKMDKIDIRADLKNINQFVKVLILCSIQHWQPVIFSLVATIFGGPCWPKNACYSALLC